MLNLQYFRVCVGERERDRVHVGVFLYGPYGIEMSGMYFSLPKLLLIFLFAISVDCLHI